MAKFGRDPTFARLRRLIRYPTPHWSVLAPVLPRATRARHKYRYIGAVAGKTGVGSFLMLRTNRCSLSLLGSCHPWQKLFAASMAPSLVFSILACDKQDEQEKTGGKSDSTQVTELYGDYLPASCNVAPREIVVLQGAAIHRPDKIVGLAPIESEASELYEVTREFVWKNSDGTWKTRKWETSNGFCDKVLDVPAEDYWLRSTMTTLSTDERSITYRHNRGAVVDLRTHSAVDANAQWVNHDLRESDSTYGKIQLATPLAAGESIGLYCPHYLGVWDTDVLGGLSFDATQTTMTTASLRTGPRFIGPDQQLGKCTVAWIGQQQDDVQDGNLSVGRRGWRALRVRGCGRGGPGDCG